jgi:hypothetical protein
MNSSDNSFLFSAYHSSHDVLVLVSVFVDLDEWEYDISGDDIALSVSCLNGYNAYFNELGHASVGPSWRDLHTLLVPKGV